MSNLSLRRLTDVLNALVKVCDEIAPPEGSTPTDHEIKELVDDWFHRAGVSLSEDVDNAVALCDAQGLQGDAQRMRKFSDDMFRRGTDIELHDWARSATTETLAILQRKFAPFPMPSADVECDEVIQLDRRKALMGSVLIFAVYVRSLLESIEGQTTSGAADHTSTKTTEGSSPREAGAAVAERPHGFFPVNVARVRESLDSLAEDINFIATGEADDRRDYDAWERRTNAGVQLVRLRAALNKGELDRADCDLTTLTVLRRVWHSLERLNYGSHHDPPNQCCGPLFLPGEIGPLDEGLPIRRADERYDPHPELRKSVPESAVSESLAQLEQVTGSGIADRTTELARRALRRRNKPHLTTKRQQWSQFPQELRKLSAGLEQTTEVAAQGDAQPGVECNLPIIDVDTRLLQVRHAGDLHNVTDSQALGLQALVDAKGDWVSWSGLGISKPSEVRKALPDALKSLIETAKGKGYRLRRK